MSRIKAIQFHQYGSPDVLRYETVDPPEVGPDYLLVDVEAAGVNPVDWRFRKGQMKWYDWFSDFPRIPGSDLAGEVLETGGNVENFEPGQHIFAMLSPLSSGTYAEQALVPADNAAIIPAQLSQVEAASLPLVALTSLQALRDHAALSQGEHVLINGASGGVGTLAVQMAKAWNTTVTGVCSDRNLEFVESLGADRVIDYNEEDFADHADTYDVIYDAFGNRTLSKVRNALRTGGRYVTTDIRPPQWLDVLVSRIKPGPRADVVVVDPDGDDLRDIAKMVAAGDLKPIVDRTYPLRKASEAHRYSETRRARGKIVLEVNAGS